MAPVYSYECPIHGVFERYSAQILGGDRQSQCRHDVFDQFPNPTTLRGCGRLCPRIMSVTNVNVDAVITPADAAASYQVDPIRHPLAYRRKREQRDAAAKSEKR